MPHGYTPAPPTGYAVPSRVVPHSVLTFGGGGAVIGGAAAAARNIRRVAEAEMSREEAVANTLKEAAGTGLATASAAAAVQAVGATGVLSLLGVLAVATGVKYLWNTATTAK